jgi:MFS family permease
MLGFSTGLLPTVLAQRLGQTGQAVGGAIVSELFLVGTITVVLSRNLSSRAAMFTGLSVLLPTLALLVLAQAERSMAMLIADSALAGVATVLGYRGSLQVVNEIAPADRRAELVSSYLVACYAGVSLPVIGIGLISQLVDSLVANLVFAMVIAVAALVALLVGLRYTEPQG